MRPQKASSPEGPLQPIASGERSDTTGLFAKDVLSRRECSARFPLSSHFKPLKSLRDTITSV